MALAGLAALVLFLLRDAVFGGRVFYQRDVHLQWFGQVESFVHAVASGAWPLWDPFVSFGQPLLANANTEVLYPLTWLNLLVHPWTYYTVFLSAHFLFAAGGLYALGKRLGISPAGSFVAAALWVASGPVVSLGNLWNHLAAAAWLPWVVLAADVAFASGALRDELLWGAAMAAQIVAGSPDVAVMTGVVVVADALRHVRWRAPRDGSHARLLGSTALAVSFAFALSAGQSLPSLELAARSSRQALGAAARTYWSVHPLGMLQTLVPMFWNDLPLRPELRSMLFESREPLLLSVYLGVPGMALAAAALAGPRRPLRGALVLVAVAASLIALGHHGPAYGMAVTLLPPLRVLRFPSKALVLTALCCALLAGMGVDAWRQPGQPDRRRRWLLAVGLPLATIFALAAGVALAGRYEAEAWGPLLLARPPGGPSFRTILAPALAKLGRVATLAGAMALLALLRRRAAPWAAAAAGLIAVTELALTHDGLNATASKDLFMLRPTVLEAIRQQDHRRLYVVDYLAEPGRSARYLGREVPYLVAGAGGLLQPAWAGALGMRIYPVPPVAAAWGVFDSYSRDHLGIQPTPLAKLYALLIRSEGTPLHLRLLRMGAVSQVLALNAGGLEDLTPLAMLPGPFFEPIRVLRVPDPLPRAYAVSGARIADDAQAFETLRDPGFDPAREVILAEGTPHGAGPPSSGAVQILELKADRVRLEADLGEAGYVVVVDAYDPGWRATVDGREAPVLKANLAFRAVPVPAGPHTVELVYRPRAVILGLLVSAAALVTGSGLMLRRPRAS